MTDKEQINQLKETIEGYRQLIAIYDEKFDDIKETVEKINETLFPLSSDEALLMCGITHILNLINNIDNDIFDRLPASFRLDEL